MGTAQSKPALQASGNPLYSQGEFFLPLEVAGVAGEGAGEFLGGVVESKDAPWAEATWRQRGVGGPGCKGGGGGRVPLSSGPSWTACLLRG